MSHNNGPRINLEINQFRQQDDEDIPDEPSPIQIKQKNILYKKFNQPRFDVKGRQIVKGTGYGISFDSFVTICVFNPIEEVLQIQDTISQCTNNQIQKKTFNKFSKQNQDEDFDDEVVLHSILKQSKQNI